MERPSNSTKFGFHCSNCSSEQAQTWAAQHFSILGPAEEQLNSSGQCFKITTTDQRTFLLHIARTTRDFDPLGLQNHVLQTLANRHLPFEIPSVVLSTSGDALTRLTNSEGSFSLQLTRLATESALGLGISIESPHQFAGIGHLLGTLDRELLQLNPTSSTAKPSNDIDGGNFIPQNIHFVGDKTLQQLLRSTYRSFQIHCQPHLSKLRRSLILNNTKRDNLLAKPNFVPNPSAPMTLPIASSVFPFDVDSQNSIVGIADFSNLQFDYLINDLAAGLASFLGCDPERHSGPQSAEGIDDVEKAAVIIAAYHQALPLREPEVAMLYDLVAMQLCIRIVWTAVHLDQQIRTNQDNRSDRVKAYAQYLGESGIQTAKLLASWQTLNRHLLHFHFRHACGFPAVPDAPAIERWIVDHCDSFAPVLDFDLRSASHEVLFYSAGCPELERAHCAASVEAYSHDLWHQMKANSIEVFIGRYLENRAIYQGENYSTNIPGDRRSIHLGIDLFLPEHRPVFAPFAGIIVSIQDNNHPLDYGPTLILSHTIDELSLQFFTLYGHLSRKTLQHITPNQRIAKGEQIAWIGESKENGGWVPHLHFQIMTNRLDLQGNFPGVASPREIEVWRQICLDPKWILGAE